MGWGWGWGWQVRDGRGWGQVFVPVQHCSSLSGTALRHCHRVTSALDSTSPLVINGWPISLQSSHTENDASAMSPNLALRHWPLTFWPRRWSLHALATWTTCANLQQNRFISFQNVMFTRMSTYGQVGRKHNVCLTGWPRYDLGTDKGLDNGRLTERRRQAMLIWSLGRASKTSPSYSPDVAALTNAIPSLQSC